MTRYRLAGTPAPFSTDDDVLIEDEFGHLYFLNRMARKLELVPCEALSIVMTFYEPVLRTRWVDIEELSARFAMMSPDPGWNTMSETA
jgi:hypothetical protein